MPHFAYLIPVVVFFGIGDHAGAIATIIFATPPMIRMALLGMKELPLALPHIMVGVNQTVMFSLFMIIIAAFIGTQDLGQEMMRALSANDVGKGLVLGFCVAFMGLIIDHLVTRWSDARRRALGLD